ncbi:MAG: 30S ribosomal protein S6e [Candidatus Aenigmatarchaeota archaeon]
MKLVISDPSTRKAHQLDLDESKSRALIGKKIGEEAQGDALGLPGYTLKITGGSDRDGFPMRPDFPGVGRKRIILIGAPGFHPRLPGQRKQKLICGNTVSETIAQVNTKVLKKGEKPLEELAPKQEKKEEKK